MTLQLALFLRQAHHDGQLYPPDSVAHLEPSVFQALEAEGIVCDPDFVPPQQDAPPEPPPAAPPQPAPALPEPPPAPPSTPNKPRAKAKNS